LISDSLIQRCSVVAEVLPTPASLSRSRTRPAKRKISTTDPRIIPTVCVYCKVLFPSKSHAFQHAAKDHKDIETARCNMCQIYVKNKTDLRIHKRDYHKFLCVYCSRYLANETAYQNHVSSMHANEVIECKRCKKSCVYFKTQSAYAKHVARKHEGAWKCIYCTYDNNFRLKGTLRSHIRHHHKDVIIVCPNIRCAEYFKTEAAKLEHEKAVHESRADEIVCEICKERVPLPNINEHMRQFHNCSRVCGGKGEKTTCCYCQKTFLTKVAVMRHVADFHSQIDTFTCNICYLCFANLELKQEHNQKVHRGKFTCLYCNNWSCTYISNLSRHLREKHQGEVIQCKYNNMCTLYFKTQGDLQKHISESHEYDTTDKLQCVYCTKIFACHRLPPHINLHHIKSVAIKCSFSKTCRTYFLTKEDQEKHVFNVHFSGKVVENRNCPHCDRVFSNFYLTKMHALNIHGKALLKCKERSCSFVSSSSVNLRKHLLEQHAETEKLKIFSCKKCDHKSKSLSNLKIHNLCMHGTENLKCSICSNGEYFKSAFALNSHLNSVHHQKKTNKVVCIHCNLSVLCLSDHVVQRPCIICNKIFTCRGLMQKHRSKCKLRD
jgi:hypothetical protein